MRPVRLELEGFTAFRERTVVDFDDVTFFALVGPTGSGKSSVIDAICFALYGTVPRYDDRRLVAPAITQGELEAKVQFDFELDGAAYTAVRIVRRTDKGASTKEARLEQGDEMIAGSADELSTAVEELIGLPFNHFTRCVVLPQGEFARFLHDKPRDRQGLLVKLLAFEVYESMAARAREIARTEGVKADQLRRRLEEELAFATAEALKEAKSRVKQLEDLRRTVEETEPNLTELQSKIEDANRLAEEAERWVSRLEELVVPKDVPELARRLAEAKSEVVGAEKQLGGVDDEVKGAREALEALPERGPLERALKAHNDLELLTSKRAEREKELEEEEDQRQDAEQALDARREELSRAQDARDEVLRTHLAHELAQTLIEGDPCPVCGQTVSELPSLEEIQDIEDAEKAVARAEKEKDKAEKAHLEAAQRVTKARGRLESLEKEIHGLQTIVKEHPERDAVRETLDRIAQAERARDDNLKKRDEASKVLKELKADLQAAEDAIKAHQTDFDRRRDELATLGPPVPQREDLAADWEELASWGVEAAEDQRKKASAAVKDAEEHGRAHDEITGKLDRAFEDTGLRVEDGRYRDAVIAALTEAQGKQRAIEEGIERAKKLREDLKTAEAEREVAHELAQHLSARGFERWLINEALARLCAGATQILRELSDGQYSLTIEEGGEFLVIDHRNADLPRPAKTLSGGETFLASLSLALALAEHLSELAASGAARLEAIFLDEGFGTLDPETLETVAAAVENLGAQGRMVGIVTHVRELADRVPVRYEVRKGPRTSTVEKVLV